MSGARRLDGRRTAEHQAGLRRRALAVLSGDGLSPPLGPITEAALGIAARIGEEVSRRLDAVPLKQAANFYAEAGIGRDPARPARLAVAFKLSDSVVEASSAPQGTRLMADANGPVIFETTQGIDLIPGAVVAVRGLDAAADAVSLPADAFAAGRPPWRDPILRRLASAAAAGAVKLQVDPAAKLDPGMLIEIGEGEAARQHKVVKVEGPLVTIEPPLEAGFAAGAAVVEAAEFAPFGAATRNRQVHALYLAHAKLLDLPSEVTIHVTGADLPAGTLWSWWGKAGENDPPAWQSLEPQEGLGLRLRKGAGKALKTKVNGHESLWLRALLPGKSSASSHGQGVTLAVGGDVCGVGRDEICHTPEKLKVGFDAIANTTPVVVNRPFHPFGREPRLYDSFYVGSDEAFSKAGAEVSLCFEFGGPNLGAIAAIPTGPQLFGVGSSGLLYRGDFTAERPLLLPFPPVPGEALFPFEDAAGIDARQYGVDVRVAIGTKGAVYLAALTTDGRLTPDSVSWVRLLPDEEHKEALFTHVAISPGPANRTVYALAELPPLESGPPVRPRLLSWNLLEQDSRPAAVDKGVEHLISLQGSEAVLIADYATSGTGANRRIRIRRTHDADFVELRRVPTAQLPNPVLRLAAFVRDADLDNGQKRISLAALDDEGRLRLVQIDTDGTSREAASESGSAADLPITFLPPRGDDWMDVRLLFATTRPREFRIEALEEEEEEESEEKFVLVPLDIPRSIGASGNSERRFVLAGSEMFVQHSEAGLLYRAAGAGGLVERLLVPGSPLYLGREAPELDEVLATETGELNGAGYRIFGPAVEGLRELLPPDVEGQVETEPFRFLEPFEEAQREATRLEDRLLSLSGPDPDGDTITVRLHSDPAGLWTLTRVEDGWRSGDELPDEDGDDFECDLLRARDVELVRAVEFTESEEETLRQRLQRGELFAVADPASSPIPALGDFGGRAYLPFLNLLDEDFQLELFIDERPWLKLGPDAAANPALSWEYWNGASWWALAPAGLADGTADFQENGGVFFRVPDDLAATDVAGKKSHWIRARLVGGDYGEARVTVSAVDLGGGKTGQVAIRDTSSIRAPYVTRLRLGYCALTPVRPEIALTHNNLGYVDQTSANEAGLEFPLFVPVAEAMNPRPVTAETHRTSDPEGCGDVCVEPSAEDRDPCAAPGAYDSCDSPCVAEPGWKRPPAGEAQGFVRGLMIGLDRPFKGNTVSFWFDAAPTGPPATLVAEMLRDGRFVPVRVVGDESYGLTESGLVTFALPVSPDRSDRLGASAHWLRLRPKLEASRWSPRLRGVHLNAVPASSIETRRMERIGSSDGTPGQTFRLAEAPVAPETLQLRVAERLDDAERSAAGVDVAAYQGMDGEWVRWLTGDPESADDSARIFGFDAEQGTIRFGDGRHGRIPPLGADLLAVQYAKVHGSRANGVAAGSSLQPISPLAGVESVLALDAAAGGTDPETVADGVRRAAAKVRHGGRIISLADLEEFAVTLVPGIAQVRAERRRGGVRLTVVGGREGAGWLRQMRSQIAEVSGYGLARPGGLELVGPRYLDLGVAIVLDPARSGLFAEAATRAAEAVAALFDAASGGQDRKGWPLGRLPDESDVAAALTAIEALATPTAITLFRIDKRSGSRGELPESIPSDVLVRLDPVSLVFERADEVAA